jgi:hypothetical protein
VLLEKMRHVVQGESEGIAERENHLPDQKPL